MRLEIPDKYIKQQKLLKKKELAWSFAHYAMGISAGVLAFFSASATKMGTPTASNLAIMSGIVAAILTFLSPASRRKAYTEARDLMRIARMRYEEEGDRTIKYLIDTMADASEIIRRR